MTIIKCRGKREQKTETRATDTASSYYLNNPPLLSTPLVKYPSNKLMIEQLDHTNCAGVGTNLLQSITESSGPKVLT